MREAILSLLSNRVLLTKGEVAARLKSSHLCGLGYIKSSLLKDLEQMVNDKQIVCLNDCGWTVYALPEK